jgi:hypothetical protein
MVRSNDVITDIFSALIINFCINISLYIRVYSGVRWKLATDGSELNVPIQPSYIRRFVVLPMAPDITCM